MTKGNVGYQDPSKADPKASLSPVVKESLDESPAEEQEEPGEELMESMLRRVIKEELAQGLAPLDKTMISHSQMVSLLDKVFPNIPSTETRSLARKLLSAAKSYTK